MNISPAILRKVNSIPVVSINFSEIINQKYLKIVNAEVPQTLLNEIYSLSIDEVSRTVKKPGFRKGFVPREILEQEHSETIKEVFNELFSKFAQKVVSLQTSSQEVMKAEYSILPPQTLPPSTPAFIRIIMWVDTYQPLESLKGKKITIPRLSIPSDEELKEMAVVQIMSVYSEPTDSPADENKVLNIKIQTKDGKELGDFTIQPLSVAETYSPTENQKSISEIHLALKGKKQGEEVEIKTEKIKAIIGGENIKEKTLLVKLESVKNIDIESKFKEGELDKLIDETSKALKRKFEEDNEITINHIILDLAGIELNISPVLKNDFWYTFMSLAEITYSKRIPYFLFAENIKDLESSFSHHSFELLFKFIREERVIDTTKYILKEQNGEIHHPTEADISKAAEIIREMVEIEEIPPEEFFGKEQESK